MNTSTPHHTVFATETARPAPFRGPFSEMFRWISVAYLKIGGWKVEGDWPDVPNMVLIAAPHTSNWDGINMIAAAGYYRIGLNWMGKKSLTTGPFGWFIKACGCVPIDRKAKNDMVGQMREAFQRSENLVLAIPPEGTRDLVQDWKTGFYHIAVGAAVPIVMSVLDYGTRTIRVSGMIDPSGDYEADLALIKSHYASAAGKFPEKFVLNN